MTIQRVVLSFPTFQQKTGGLPAKPPLILSEKQLFTVSIYGGLPDSVEPLQILEFEVGRKMSYLNGKATKLHANAQYCQAKGDVKTGTSLYQVTA
jgi:hypothetical protein